MRWKSPGSSRFDGVPRTVASPRSARRMFISRRIAVVLPAPLGPMSANTEPSGTRKSRSSTASKRPNFLVRPRVSTIIRDSLESAQLGPRVFHRLLHFIEPRTDAHGLDNELFDFVFEQPLAIARACFRRLRHDGADTRLGYQPAFLDEVLHHLVGGVRMDLQIHRQGAHRGEGLTGLQLASKDGAGGREHHLIEDRSAGDQLELERDHGPSSVTALL